MSITVNLFENIFFYLLNLKKLSKEKNHSFISFIFLRKTFSKNFDRNHNTIELFAEIWNK